MSEAKSARTDRLVALGAVTSTLVLYLLTLCPTVFWYDSAEYVAAAVTRGVPHPPGYPLYTLLGWLFVQLPVDPAYAMNLFSALSAAIAVGFAYLIGRRLDLGQLGALVGALTLGASRLFWSQSLIAEVYCPALALLLAVFLLLLRGARADRPRVLVGAAFLAGLGLGLHLFIATCGLGLAVVVLGSGLRFERPGDLRQLISRQKLARRAGVAALCLLAAGIGAMIYLYIPWRASQSPELNFANPSTWDRFIWFVTGGNYKTWFLTDYDISARALKIGGIIYDQFLIVGLLLVALGLVDLTRRLPLAALAITLAVAGNIHFFFDYRVHDLEVFFLPTIALLCLLVGSGTHAAAALVKKALAEGPLSRMVPVMLAALAFFPPSLVLANYGAVDLSDYTAARDYGEALCRQLPKGAVIVNFTSPADWKNDAVFSKYFQIVLRKRRDVRVPRFVPAKTVLRLQRRGIAVFAYFPDPRIRKLFNVRKEGVIWRLGPPKIRPPRL